MNKLQVCQQYRIERRKLRDTYFDNPNIKERDIAIFNLSKKYIKDYPFLNNKDCSGRGLPCQQVEFLGRYWNVS